MKRVVIVLFCIILLISFIYISRDFDGLKESFQELSEEDQEIKEAVEYIVEQRNMGVLNGDEALIATLYDRSTKYGKWAYEHETIKQKYMKDWSRKQDIKFISINPDIVIRSIKDFNGGKRINFLSCTTFSYKYKDTENIDDFTVGTNHSMVIKKSGGKWVVSREWYKDPMADKIRISDENIAKSHEIINSNTKSDYQSTDRRKAVVAYAEKYCGTASKDNNYRYNKKYRNYNYVGGDCANFASQMLYEGGKLRQNGTWKYYKNAGSKAWVNAQAFKSYMVYSGRATVIASGSYMKVLKASYKLMPGDFVAYEKKGTITHISMITGADSKGYPYVHSHNSDRSKVPFDIGFSSNNVKYWLVRVHL